MLYVVKKKKECKKKRMQKKILDENAKIKLPSFLRY